MCQRVTKKVALFSVLTAGVSKGEPGVRSSMVAGGPCAWLFVFERGFFPGGIGLRPWCGETVHSGLALNLSVGARSVRRHSC